MFTQIDHVGIAGQNNQQFHRVQEDIGDPQYRVRAERRGEQLPRGQRDDQVQHGDVQAEQAVRRVAEVPGHRVQQQPVQQLDALFRAPRGILYLTPEERAVPPVGRVWFGPAP